MSILLLSISFFVIRNASAVSNNNDPSLDLSRAINELQASDQAWRINDAEYRELSKKPDVSETDLDEFASFVADLKYSVFEGCEAVRQLGGDANLHGVDCAQVKEEDNPYPHSLPDTLSIKRETTFEEKADLLSEQLRKLEADFDGMILQQQPTLNQSQMPDQSNNGWSNDGMSNQESDLAAGNENGASVNPSGSSSDPFNAEAEPPQWEAEPGAGPGMRKEGKLPDFNPGSIGDTADDGILARQLKEAAEVETDPVLKEKLWEAYKEEKAASRK